MDFPATELVDLISTCIHFSIGERQRKIRCEHALERGHVCVKKCLARIALKLEHFSLSRRLGEGESAGQNSHQNNKGRSLHPVSGSVGNPWPIGSVRRPSLFPKFSRRRLKTPVPYAQTSARCLTRCSAPEPSGLYIVPGRKTRPGSH